MILNYLVKGNNIAKISKIKLNIAKTSKVIKIIAKNK